MTFLEIKKLKRFKELKVRKRGILRKIKNDNRINNTVLNINLSEFFKLNLIYLINRKYINNIIIFNIIFF